MTRQPEPTPAQKERRRLRRAAKQECAQIAREARGSAEWGGGHLGSESNRFARQWRPQGQRGTLK